MASKLRSIPNGAYALACVSCACVTYLMEGDSLSFGGKDGLTLENNISTKLDLQYMKTVTKLDDQFRTLEKKFSTVEEILKQIKVDLNDWGSRIHKLEREVETLQMINTRQFEAIALLAKKTQCTISEKDIRDHISDAAENKIEWHIKRFADSFGIGKKDKKV